MKRRTPLRSKPETQREWERRSREKQMSAQQRASRIKTRRKSKRERDEYTARVYGSKARLLAIKALPCAVPGCTNRPCENHHIENGGMGRKAGWTKVVPLCGAEHHDIYHNECGSPEAFDARFGTDLRALAEELAVRIPKEGAA